MTRGTTPIHYFTLPFNCDLVTDLRITYAQGDKTIITKKLEDVSADGKTFSVKLTQEETLSFDSSKMVEIQLKVLTPENNVLVSGVIVKGVRECLNDEVLV